MSERMTDGLESLEQAAERFLDLWGERRLDELRELVVPEDHALLDEIEGEGLPVVVPLEWQVAEIVEGTRPDRAVVEQHVRIQRGRETGEATVFMEFERGDDGAWRARVSSGRSELFGGIAPLQEEALHGD